jgi:hypothetical protein
MRSLLQFRFERTGRGDSEAEGMTATNADVFDPLSPNLVDRDEVAKHYAGQRMPDHSERSLGLEKRVTASARVFSCLRSRFHDMDAMT